MLASPLLDLGLPQLGVAIHAHHAEPCEQFRHRRLHFRTRDLPAVVGRIPDRGSTVAERRSEPVQRAGVGIEHSAANGRPVVHHRAVESQTHHGAVRHDRHRGRTIPRIHIEERVRNCDHAIEIEPLRLRGVALGDQLFDLGVDAIQAHPTAAIFT